MIASFRHRGLRALYVGKDGAARGAGTCREAPGYPGGARSLPGPEGLNLSGFSLHELKGPLKGHYAGSVSGNWRVTFRFQDGTAVDVDYH